MSTKKYSNFVRPGTLREGNSSLSIIKCDPLNGEEAKKLYLDVVKEINDPCSHSDRKCDYVQEERSHHDHERRALTNVSLSDKDLYLSVQNDDIDTLKLALELCPDNIHKLDEYGWSLLMMACQANSIEVVKELLKRGVDTAVKDKAGNTAQSLVIRNRNHILADILLSNNKRHEAKKKTKRKSSKQDEMDNFYCDLCKIKFYNRELHLSSTIHNINLSKGKKIPTNYVIPESNKGFQLMLKGGWDKESGLGPDGSGKKYPIKAEQKKDRKGLGHQKRPLEVDPKPENLRHKNRRKGISDRETNRKFEINFRRQFY